MKHLFTIAFMGASLAIGNICAMHKQTGKEVVAHHELHAELAGKKVHFINVPEALKHLFKPAKHTDSTTTQEASAQSTQEEGSEKKVSGFHPILSAETKIEDKLIQEAETVVIDFACKELEEAKTMVNAKLEETENKLYNIVVYKAAPLAVTFMLGYLVAKHSHTTNN